jgi:hypothetical protein
MYRKKMEIPNNIVYALEKTLFFADPSLVEEEDLKEAALMAQEDGNNTRLLEYGDLYYIESEISLIVPRSSNVLFCCQQEEVLAKEVKAKILSQFLADQELTVEALSMHFDSIVEADTDDLDYAHELVAEFNQEIKDVDIQEMHPANFQSLLSRLYQGAMSIFIPV